MYSNSINCTNCSAIFCCTRLNSLTNIPCTHIFNIKCALLLVPIHRTEPMPVELYHTVTISITIKIDCSLYISIIPRWPIRMPRIMGRVILHIISSYHWIDTYSIFNLLRLVFRVSTNYMSTVRIVYSLIKMLDFCWRIARNKIVPTISTQN